MNHNALKHQSADDVAIVIQDTEPGTRITALTLNGQEADSIEAIENIPMGHKIAVRDLAEGKEIIEYGRSIGKASKNIAKGAHVHIHNLKSIRWGKE